MMKSLERPSDFKELIEAILNFHTTDEMIQGVIEFWRHKFGIGEGFHIRSGIGAICLHAGYNAIELSSGVHRDLPNAIEIYLESIIKKAHRLQANGYTIVLEKGELDPDNNEERFFKIVPVKSAAQ